MQLRYMVDLFCWDVPPDSQLATVLEPPSESGLSTTPDREYFTEDGSLPVARFLSQVEHFRDELALCSESSVTLGFFPKGMLADFSLRIPHDVLRRLAACGLGLDVSVYPGHGNEQTRYGGASLFVVAGSGAADASAERLLPGIRRNLLQRGFSPLSCQEDDPSFTEPETFAATCIPENHEPSLISFCKYLGQFVYPSFVLNKLIVARLAEQHYELELSFSFPQRRGRRLRTRLMDSSRP